jgi:hypothetical protein
MTRFVVESDFWKLVSSDAASLLLALWSMMSAVGEMTLVGADVRPDAAEPVRGTGEPVCEICRVCEWGLPEQERRTAGVSLSVSLHVHVGGTRAIQWSEPLH